MSITAYKVEAIGHDRWLQLYRQLWTLQFHLLSQYKSAQPKGRINDKYPDVLPIHALPQFLDAATGGKTVRDGPAQQVFILFKKASTLISSMPKRMLS